MEQQATESAVTMQVEPVCDCSVNGASALLAEVPDDQGR